MDGDLKLPNYPENMGENVREVIGHCGGVSDDHTDAEFWFRILYRIVFSANMKDRVDCVENTVLHGIDSFQKLQKQCKLTIFSQSSSSMQHSTMFSSLAVPMVSLALFI